MSKLYLNASKSILVDLESFIELNEIDINAREINQNNINKPVNKFGETLMYLACFTGNIKIADWLKDSGADINVRDISGQTPLHQACAQKNTKVAGWLIDNGAYKYLPDDLDETPIDKVRSNGYDKFIGWFMDKTIGEHAKNELNQTLGDQIAMINREDSPCLLRKIKVKKSKQVFLKHIESELKHAYPATATEKQSKKLELDHIKLFAINSRLSETTRSSAIDKLVNEKFLLIIARVCKIPEPWLLHDTEQDSLNEGKLPFLGHGPCFLKIWRYLTPEEIVTIGATPNHQFKTMDSINFMGNVQEPHFDMQED